MSVAKRQRTMNKRVLDASVLITFILNESLLEDPVPIVSGASMSAINYAEVLTRLMELKVNLSNDFVQLAFSLLNGVESFTASQAYTAAALRAVTRSRGLSLGDRACLALAIESGAVAYTADRTWADITLPCEVRLLR